MVNDENEKIDILREWLLKGKSRPYMIGIVPTEKCNLNCKYCDSGSKTKSNLIKDEISEKKLIQIIQEARILGVKRIDITGSSEPFYNPNEAMNIIKAIRYNGMNGHVSTNGTLFTRRMIETLVKLKFEGISFGVDSADAQTHDYLRGQKNSFRKCIDAIKYLQLIKSTLNTTKPSVNVSTVLVNKNYNTFRKTLLFLSKLNIDSWQIQDLMNTDNHPHYKELQPNNSQIILFKTHLHSLKKMARKFNISINLRHFINMGIIKESSNISNMYLGSSKYKFSAKCLAPWLALVIHATGHIYVCEYNTRKSSIDTKSLEDIWIQDKYINDLRKEFINNHLPKFCSNCCTQTLRENIKILKKL